MNYVSMVDQLGLQVRVVGDELVALCPLHDERSASFAVNARTGDWNCLAGCGGGSFPELVRRVRGCTWMEAVAWVRSAGCAMSNEELHNQLLEGLLGHVGGHSSGAEDKSQGIAQAWDYYASLDLDTVPLAILRRGLTVDLLRRWGIRYDGLREQLVIPVTAHGEFVGYQARRMAEGAQPRFLNALEKSSVLFGRDRIPQGWDGAILLTEGPLKAIWAANAGLPAVATFGVQLSGLQREVLKCSELVLGLDADDAGHLATLAIGNKFPWPASELSVLSYPAPAKDANDCTLDQLVKAWDARVPYITWRIGLGRIEANPRTAGTVGQRRQAGRHR